MSDAVSRLSMSYFVPKICADKSSKQNATFKRRAVKTEGHIFAVCGQKLKFI